MRYIALFQVWGDDQVYELEIEEREKQKAQGKRDIHRAFVSW